MLICVKETGDDYFAISKCDKPKCVYVKQNSPPNLAGTF